MSGFLTKIGIGIIAIAIAIAGILDFAPKSQFTKLNLDFQNTIEKYEREIAQLKGELQLQKEQMAQLGATIPKVVALFETSLATKISSTATSMTLTSGTDKAGNDLSGYICFVIDEGTASEEFVCGDVSGTSVSNMIRGIDPVDGDTEVSALKKEHRRGASVKVSNYPYLGILARILNGDETIPNKLSYESQPTFTSDEDIITKKYADDLSYSGAPDASDTVKGVVEIATLDELVAHTQYGDTGAELVLPNSLTAVTSQSAHTIVVSDENGKIDQSYLNLEDDYSWTGTHTFNGTTNISSLNMSGNITMTGNKITGLGAPTTNGDAVRYEDVVFDTGDQTIDGIKTFSSIPVLPASDPTQDNQAVRKAYVDSFGLTNVAFDTYTMPSSQTSSWTQDFAFGFIPKVLLVFALDNNGAISNGVATGTGTDNQRCIEKTDSEEYIHTGCVYYNNEGIDDYVKGQVTAWGTTITITFTPNSTYGHSAEDQIILLIALK